jgi:photosystem II stability/assembly factor-like uncharacterized protein
MRLLLSVLLFSVTSVSAVAQLRPTPAGERLEGIARRKALEANSYLNNIPFRNIGPVIMSGRAVDLDVNPADPTEFYVAYASGGLWYTRNNGQSFKPVFDDEDVITVGDFAVDWKTHNIWIGTGEVNSSRSSYAGVGMYFSSDSGKTWQHKGLPESHHIGKVLLHPSDPNTLWVAVLGHLFSPNRERGVYKTTDGGSTWKQVLSVDDNTGAVELQADPKNPDVIYAAMWHRERRTWNFVEGGSTSGIYKSTDGGASWKRITVEGSGFPTGDGVGRIGISVFPGNTDILYAVVDNQNKRPEDPRDTSVLTAKDLKGVSKEKFLALSDDKLESFLRDNDFPDKYTAKKVKELVKTDSVKVDAVTDYLNDANNSLFDTPIIGAEVYRSENGGVSWKKTNAEYLKHLFYTYGYYFGKVFVAPQDDKKIILCGVPLIMSRDGGKTFRTIDGDNVHGDHHAVWMNPAKDGHLIICNDGGINISYDDGASWYKANNPPVGQFYSVNVDMAKPYNVYGGLQDNGVWTGSSTSDLSSEWQQQGEYPYRFIMGGDGMQVMVDTRDNSTVYTGYQFGYYYRLDKNNPGYDHPIHPRNDLGEPNLRFNWQSPIWLSKHNQDILYFGSNRFHRSMNKGEDMKTLSGDLTAADKKGDVPFNTITAIHESPIRFGLLYAGTDDGRIWISKDAGQTWSRIDNIPHEFAAQPGLDLEDVTLPNGIYVSRVVASAHKEGRVYAVLNGCRSDHFKPYIYVSENYGNDWSRLSASLPMEPVNVIREDVEKEDILYAGTDNGLYVTLDRGKTWMTMNGGLPRVAIHDLAVHPRDGEVILGTHGRSIYVASVTDLRKLDDSLRGKPLAVVTSEDVTWSSGWGKKRDEYSEAAQPEAEWCYWSSKPGLMKYMLQSEGGLVLASGTDTAEAGLNYGKLKLSVDPKIISRLQKELAKRDRSKPVVLKPAEDGNYYVPESTYRLVIADAEGVSTEFTFKVASKQNRKRASENAYPEED